jgi:glutathione S-transferase
MNIAFKSQSQFNELEIMIALMDEMIAIIAEENACLAKGLPASRSKQLARKIELAAYFEKWVADAATDRVNFRVGGEALRAKLMERTRYLQVVTDENITKLRAAIAASQRRIDAVMGAIKERMSDSSPYAANGRLTRSGMSYSANLQA